MEEIGQSDGAKCQISIACKRYLDVPTPIDTGYLSVSVGGDCNSMLTSSVVVMIVPRILR